MKNIIQSLKLVGLGLFLVLASSATILYTRAPGHAYAVGNTELNFQARLLDSNGGIAPDGTSYSVQFKLYTAASGGAAVWTETQTSVAIHNGYLSVHLGSVNNTLDTLDWSQQHWLTMNVNGDGEMNPRLKLTSVPYAFAAGRADGLVNGSGVLSANDIAQLAPSSSQVINSALAALRLNQTGAGGLIQFQNGGVDVLTVDGSGNVNAAGNGTFSGGTVNIGAAAQAGGLALSDGSSNTGTIKTNALGQNTTYHLPDPGVANADICLSTGNCGGTGDINQNGNSFGTAVTIGSNDAYNLNFETGNTTQLTIDTSGNVDILNGALKVGGTTVITSGRALQNVTGANANGVSFNADVITSGTLSDGRLSTNVTLQGNTFNGNSQLVKLDASGKFVAIDGSALTNLTAANLNGQVAVANGGTGLSSVTSNGILYGNGTSALGVATGTQGQFLQLNSSGVPTFTSLSGDVTLSNSGVATIGADAVALGTDTTGNYVASLGTLTGLSVTGNSGEGSTPALSVIYGSSSNTAAQGNSALSFTGSGNLTGSVSGTAGGGFTTNTLDVVSNPSFSGLITGSASTTGLALTGAPTNSATSSLVQIGSAIASGNTATNGGTYIGLNAPSSGAGSAADFLNFQVNGSSKLKVDNTGAIYINGTQVCSSSGCSSTGAAGGDLSGNYPNPTVAKINGVSLGSTTATAGNLLIGSGTQWISQALSGDATLTAGGVLTIANGAVTNAKLQNSSFSTSFGTNLSGSSSVSLGGTLSVNISSTPTFTSVTANSLTSSTGQDLALTAVTGNITLGSNTTLKTTTGLTIDLNNSTSDQTLTLNNSGTKAAFLNLQDGGLQIAGSTVLTNGKALQNLTGISTTGSLVFNSFSGAAGLLSVDSSGNVSVTANSAFEQPLTFNNGLTRSSNTIKLGGALTANTDIPLSGFNLTLSGSGKVGIGTSGAPSETLDVVGNARFDLSSGAAGYIRLHPNSGGDSFIQSASQNLILGYNLRFNGSNYVYDASTTGTLTLINSTGFSIVTAPSGTAGNNASTLNTRLTVLTSNGNVGIGTTGPDRRLDVLDTSGPQLRLTYTDGSVYTDLQTDSSGNLTVDASGTKTILSDNLQLGTNTILDSGGNTRLAVGTTNAFTGDLTVSGNTDIAGTLKVGTSDAFSVNADGDITAVSRQLDGTSTANGGSGLGSSTSLTLTSAANFDVGNYVQMNSNNCGGTGINPCYAKITAKATNTLTITPALTWTNGSTVNEFHIPEVGGIDTSQTLANRYGRGYFIAGVATGNGTTYYSEEGIQTSLTQYDIQTSASNGVINIGTTNNVTSVSIGSASTSTTIYGNVTYAGNVTAPSSGTAGYLQRSGTTLSPANAGDNFTTSGNISTTGSGTITSAGAISAPTSTNTINGLIINSGALSGITGITFTSGGLNINNGGITNAGALAGVTNITLNGTISGGTTITGTTLNGTTGINTGASGGTQRIDSSGNLVNIGNLTATAGLTIASTGSNDITLNSGSNIISIDSTDTTLRRATSGNFTIELNGGASASALVLNNTGAGAASLVLTDGDLSTGGTPTVRLTNAGALTNITGLTLTSGSINVGSGGITNAGSIGGVTGLTFTSGSLNLAGGGITNAGSLGSVTGITFTSGSLNLASGGITNAGSIAGVAGLTLTSGNIAVGGGNITGLGTNLTANAGLTIASGGSGDLTLDSASNKIVLAANETTLQRTTTGTNTNYTLDLSDSVATSLILNNSGTGAATLALTDGDLATGSTPTVRLTNAGALTNITGVTLTSGGINVGGGGITNAGSISGITGLTLTSGALNLGNGGITNSGALAGITGITFTSGSLNLNNGGITNTGSIAGATTISASGAITAATTTNTINGLIVNSGALSGITTINASGAITAPTATNTINNLVINSGALSSVTGITFSSGNLALGGGNISGVGTLGLSGAITAATSTNTINGLIINAGALSGVTTLNASGAITAATSTNTINGLVINSGALSSVTTINASGAVTAATTVNTINGLIINSGALSGITGFAQTSGAHSVTGTGAITLGAGSNSLTIDSSAFDVSSAGALSGITTIGLSGAITGATSTNTINGLIINSGSLSGITGYSQTSGNFAMSGTGTFGTGTGLVSLNGAATVTGTNTFTVNGGLTSLNAGATVTGGTLLVQRTGTGSGVIIDRTDGVIGSLKSGTSKVAFFFDDTGSFSISKDTRANITTGSGSGIDLMTVSNTGAVVFQNSTNSSSAFAIKNAVGAPVFLVDTTTNNLVTNPGFEVDVSNWVVDNATSLTRNTTENYHGIASMQVNIPTTSTGGVKTTAFNSALASSTQYTLSFYAKLGSGTVTTLVAGRSDNGTTKTACSLSITSIVTGGWQRYSCTFTTGTVSGSPFIYINTTTTTAVVAYIDAVQLVAGATAQPYSIGNIQLRGVIADPVTFMSGSNSTTAFTVNTATGSNIFSIDTLNNRINFGTSTGLVLNGDTITDLTGNGLTVSSGALTILPDTGSGLSTSATGLSLLRTCTNNQILKWNGTAWACAADATGISDVRFKENIQDVGPVLDKVKDLRVVTYNFKCNDPAFETYRFDCDTHTGVIAQEVEQIFPDAVVTKEDGHKEVNFAALNFYNLKAVGELAQKVDSIHTANGDTTNGVQTGGTLRLDSNGVLQNITGLNMVGGGATLAGGLNNTGGGITNAGAISGATSIDAQAITLNADSTHNLLELKKDGNGVFTIFNDGSMQIKLDAANAFAVRDGYGRFVFNIDSKNGKVKIGAGDSSKTVLFTLDNRTLPDDPPGEEGASYYNSALQRFRCYTEERWVDCLPVGDLNDPIAMNEVSWAVPSGETEFKGSPRTRANYERVHEFRVRMRVTSAAPAGASCKYQYALSDNGPWKDLSADPNGQDLKIDQAGTLKTNWLKMPKEARTDDTFVRVVCRGGNGVQAATFYGITIQLR